MPLSNAAKVLLEHAPPDFERVWTDRIAWRLTAHAYQIAPKGVWRGWMMQGGRGIGKTLTGARDAAEHCLDYSGLRYGVISPTLGDTRGIAFEGETGLINVLTHGVTVGAVRLPGLGLIEGTDYEYNKSLLEIDFANGSHIKGYGSEKPDRLRGPQHHRLWFEELASFRDGHKGDALQTTFNNAILGLRLPIRPGWRDFPGTQYIVTTTPRRVKLITDLVSRDNVQITRGTTYDNLANLDPEFGRELLRYEGTHLGRQELLGEIIRVVPGALWKWAMIDPHRMEPDRLWVATGESEDDGYWRHVGLTFNRVVIGVDPSGGGDEIGIVGAGKIISPCPCGREDSKGVHYAVIVDNTTSGSPEHWGRTVADTFHNYAADRIVAETNFGGDMVLSTLRAVDRSLPTKKLHASRGKAIRAEPVSAAYEQGRVHHLEGFARLEDEYTSWVPGDDWSPNRLDAAVWALTELGLESGGGTTLRDRSVTAIG